ncbi:SSU ribosomal protein S19E, partial [Giardia duodenalis]
VRQRIHIKLKYWSINQLLGMSSVTRVPADVFINSFAAHLKNRGIIKCPAFTDYVKTGVSRQYAPRDADWFYIKAASVIRHFYISGSHSIGVAGLARKYSSLQKGKTTPHHTKRASCKVIRSIVSQFLGQKLLIAGERGRHISPNGRKMVEDFAEGLQK